MTIKQKRKKEEEIHQRILERIRNTPREEWQAMIDKYEAEYAAADAEFLALQGRKSPTPSPEACDKAA